MRFPIRPCVLALAVALGACWTVRADADTDAVVVTLRPSASATSSPVCVGQVASLSGGSRELRSRIESLDLAERPARGKSLLVLAELVSYRLQLAGIERGSFRVEGAPVVQVSAAGSVTEDDFLQAARDALRDRFPGRPEDLVVSPAQAPAVPQLTLAAKAEVRFEAEVREPMSVPGRCRIDVALVVNRERLGVVPVLLDVKVYQSVAVAVRRIEAGEVLSEENVRIERRALDAMDSCVTPKELEGGRKARRVLPAGQMIPPSAIEPSNADNPILIKQHDPVKVVARVGKLCITVLAEAQQDGRAGESIRVRNVDSRKDVVGRVVSRGLVEVEY
ncbi:MAG TPA: flagellar basal body P-ring formation chaperone FlgA [Gemmataceae bacterium]|nr:flagellar basal body P-ring formation chaperone FlgA [Gemmataceae bacterium]